jgi:hypothetical protein
MVTPKDAIDKDGIDVHDGGHDPLMKVAVASQPTSKQQSSVAAKRILRQIAALALPSAGKGMKLDCYRIHDDAPELIPARASRPWMDATGNRFAYRCTPLTMANSTGWELLCPSGVTATWNGGVGLSDLVIEYHGPRRSLNHFAGSVFGHGVLTFHPGYLFRTDPEWGLWCRGAPNSPKDGIAPLDGLVETDWLPFTFTMNWLFTRPGSVRFEADEPFCFIFPLPHMSIEAIRPAIRPLAEDPELQAEYATWCGSRAEFNKLLREGDPATTKQKWQRFYLTGRTPKDMAAPDTHRVKRKMAEAKGSKPRAEASGKKVALPVVPPKATALVKQNIIWIASYPKSGNTWVRVFIHNLLRESRGESSGAQDINRLDEHTAWEVPAGPFEEVLGRSFSQATSLEISRVRSEVQQRLANSRAFPFFVKTHLCFGQEHGYATINLNATLAAIYVVRNPLDVVISLSHHAGQTLDASIVQMATLAQRTTRDARNGHEIIGTWSQHVASWIGIVGRPILVIRYEDMLSDPERTFARLARFLRLAPTDEQLKRAIARSSFAELRRQEEAHGFNERPPTADQQFFRVGRAGQWREILSKKQIGEIYRSHAPAMQRFGYVMPDCGGSVIAEQVERELSIPMVKIE